METKDIWLPRTTQGPIGRRTDEVKEESAPFPELNYLNGGVSLEGVESIDGKKAYKVKISDNKVAYYDMETGLKLQEIETQEIQGKQVSSTTAYDNYTEVAGIMFPFMISQTVGPQKFDFVVKEIKVNEGVSDVDFE